jgi:predicted transcriptional regulator/energy-coupling factor transporter ATP-binding protein EcfA2
MVNLDTAKRSKTRATANDLEVLRLLLEGHSRLETIAATLNLASSTAQDRLKQIKRKNYAETVKGGKTWSITPEGVQVLEHAKNAPPVKLVKPLTNGLEGADTQGANAENAPTDGAVTLPKTWKGLQALEVWQKLMAVLPLPEYRAAVRLVLALALLRNRAPHLSPMPWVGLYGSTGTGKSTIAKCVRALIGGHFFQVGTMSSGETQGRRSRKPPYQIEQTPRTLLGPITDLDELAEASPEVQAAIYALMQQMGPVVTLEGQEFDNKAVIVATWNPKAQTVPLPVGAIRRGILLDTTPFHTRLEKAFNHDMLSLDIQAVLDDMPQPFLHLANLPAPQALERELLRTGQRALYSVLKTPGEQPLNAVAGLAAAYAVLFQLEDKAALGEAVSDFARVIATQAGIMRDGWDKSIQAFRGQMSLSDDLEMTAPDMVLASPVVELRQELELTKRRSLLNTRAANARDPLKKHLKQMEPAEREIAAPLIAALESIGEGAPHAKPERLEAMQTELDTLEQQALTCAQLVQTRLKDAEQQARYLQQAEDHRRKLAKERIKEGKRLAREKRDLAKRLRNAVMWSDSKEGTTRASERDETWRYCFRHYLEYRQVPLLPDETGQGLWANMKRKLENYSRSIASSLTFERGTNNEVTHQNRWAMNKAEQLEQEAKILEAGGTLPRALPSTLQPRALPSTLSNGQWVR